MTTVTTTTISGSSGPVVLANNGTLIVSTDGSVTNGGAIATAVFDNGNIAVLTNNGHITAMSIGGTSTVAVRGTEIGTLTNTGVISGLGAAIVSDGDISKLTNSGTLSSTSFSTVIVGNDLGTLTNSGAILSADGDGVAVEDNGGTLTNPPCTLTNSGVVSGYDTGVDVSGKAIIVNQVHGTIQSIGTNTGLLDAGVFASGQCTLTNNGVISSLENVAVSLGGTDSTIVNAGTLSGVYAVNFFRSGDTLVLDPRSVVEGIVSDFANDGTVVLGGMTANTQTFASTQYSGFSTIAFDNAHATLVGSAADLAAEAITGFARGDAIELDDFSATRQFDIRQHPHTDRRLEHHDACHQRPRSAQRRHLHHPR